MEEEIFYNSTNKGVTLGCYLEDSPSLSGERIYQEL
jgi:hypothetical protein